MKQLVFIHLLNDFSGSPKVLSQVIEACKEKGYPVNLYTGKSSTGFLSNTTEKHYFYFYKRFNNRYLTLFSFMFSQVILAIKLLKYKNKDVLFYINTMLPFGAGLAGKILGKPVIYHIHETYLNPPILKKFLRAVIKLSAKKIIFVSKSVKQLESFKGINQYIIYNTLPKEFKSKNIYKWKEKGVFNVLMISSLKMYKGINEFIDVARKLKLNSEITFTLILNAEKHEVESYFKNMKLPLNVKLVTKQKNVIKFYKDSNLVVNLSRVDECIETFGLTIIEAMAFGVPVIVPPVGGPSEIVTNGVEGYLISSYNVEEISQKIIILSNDKEKCLALSKNAYKRSLDFNEAEFNSKIIETIEAK